MNHTISNLQLSVIMAAYVGNECYCSHFPPSETFDKQVNSLLINNIISMNGDEHCKYAITEKGRFYLDSILATSFPVEVKSWMIPKT